MLERLAQTIQLRVVEAGDRTSKALVQNGRPITVARFCTIANEAVESVFPTPPNAYPPYWETHSISVGEARHLRRELVAYLEYQAQKKKEQESLEEG